MVDDWYSSLGESKIVGTVALDLRRAFDLVNIEILLSKYVKNNNIILRFRSYLCNRYQIVKMDQFHSQASQITCGIPQGSILGPFLFNMFVNDLPLCILNCNIHLFADDTNIYFCGDNINVVQTALQRDLDNIFRWCELNRLIINPLKTKAMILCTPQK